MNPLLAVLTIIASLIVYFLPIIIGCNKRDSYAIFLLNFLFGWTLVGWIIALVWAFTKDNPTGQPRKQSYQYRN